MLSSFSCVRLFVSSWTVAHQAPLSMGFSSQEYWSGLPCPPPGDLPDLGIKPMSPVAPVLQIVYRWATIEAPSHTYQWSIVSWLKANKKQVLDVVMPTCGCQSPACCPGEARSWGCSGESGVKKQWGLYLEAPLKIVCNPSSTCAGWWETGWRSRRWTQLVLWSHDPHWPLLEGRQH